MSSRDGTPNSTDFVLTWLKQPEFQAAMWLGRYREAASMATECIQIAEQLRLKAQQLNNDLAELVDHFHDVVSKSRLAAHEYTRNLVEHHEAVRTYNDSEVEDGQE